jgi:ribonuclease HII
VNRPTLDLERSFWERGLSRVVGVDEAGVGPLSGPVVAAAVLLLPGFIPIDRVRDSKTLSETQRNDLVGPIRLQACAVGVGAASVAEVERLNVLRASHLAMSRALRQIGGYDVAIIDGRPIRDIDLGSHITVVDADDQCYSVACASIVAKVTRDRLMAKLSLRYPAYGWDRNAGYGTAEHLRALLEEGPTPYHRKTFAPVQAAIESRSGRGEPMVQPL